MYVVVVVVVQYSYETGIHAYPPINIYSIQLKTGILYSTLFVLYKIVCIASLTSRYTDETRSLVWISTCLHYRSLALLRKSPKVSGDLREFTGECNLEILYSSPLLGCSLARLLACLLACLPACLPACLLARPPACLHG